MCTRYQLLMESAGARAILFDLKRRYPNATVRRGEIFPTNLAPILMLDEHYQVRPEAGIWGFPKPGEREPQASVNTESVSGDPVLEEPLRAHRCAVPTNGFFGWSKDKKKYVYTGPGGDLLYLGGVYGNFGGERRFVILTSPTSEKSKGLKGHQPVVISGGNLRKWLEYPHSAMDLLQQTPPHLNCTTVD